MQSQTPSAIEESISNISKSENLEDTIKILSFNLNEETYCIEINDIREMIDIGQITKVPLTPDIIVGVVNVRGEITTIVDIKKLLGLESTTKNDDSKIILTDIAGNLVGILADSINGTIELCKDLLQPALAPIENIMPGYIKGQTKWNNELLIALNIKNILLSETITELETRGKASKRVF